MCKIYIVIVGIIIWSGCFKVMYECLSGSFTPVASCPTYYTHMNYNQRTTIALSMSNKSVILAVSAILVLLITRIHANCGIV